MRIVSIFMRMCCFSLTAMAVNIARAEHLVQSSTEMRTYIYLQISDEKLRKLLPEGWIANPGTKQLQGANIGVVLIEGLAAADAENKPVPFHYSYVVIGALAKQLQSGIGTFMVVNGFLPPSQPAPGPYGAYTNATVSMLKRVKTDDADSNRSEAWTFATDSGERLEFSIEFQLGTAVKSHVEPRVYSGIKPEFYRIYKVDQTTDTVHSATPEGKKAKLISFSAKGFRLGKIFDGGEKIVAVVSVPAYQRTIYLPD